MKRELVITLELEEAEHELEYAMDSIKLAIGHICSPSEFVKAEYNGELLIDRFGHAQERVKNSFNYEEIMQILDNDSE